MDIMVIEFNLIEMEVFQTGLGRNLIIFGVDMSW